MRKLRAEEEIRKEQKVLMSLMGGCKSLWSFLSSDEYGDYDLLRSTHSELATMFRDNVDKLVKRRE